MKFPDISLNYPSGSVALEIKGIDAEIMESIQLGSGFLSLAVTKLPKLQPLINDFYEIYTKVKALAK